MPASEKVSPVEFQRYVAYARQHVHPQLSPPAEEVLKAYYLDARAMDVHSGNGMRVTVSTVRPLFRPLAG